MTVFHWIVLSGFTIFILSTIVQLARLIGSGQKEDPSMLRGNTKPAVFYSLTFAMLPVKKETAYLHLPTYTAGILYHVGTFLSFFWLAIIFFNVTLPSILKTGSFLFLMITGVCGIGILFKRIIKEKLRYLSNPDDYASNLLVTAFQIITGLSLVRNEITSIVFLIGGIIFIYIPLGKLRHAVYFFTTRIYLGLFYGKRGVWPPKKRKSWQINN